MDNEFIAEIQSMQDYLEITCSDDVNEMIGRISVLNVYMARSGKMLADAIETREKAIQGVYAEHGKSIAKMPATVANKFIDSQVSEENKIVKWLDRINATCKHQSDNLRTLISYAKEQLSLERKGY